MRQIKYKGEGEKAALLFFFSCFSFDLARIFRTHTNEYIQTHAYTHRTVTQACNVCLS